MMWYGSLCALLEFFMMICTFNKERLTVFSKQKSMLVGIFGLENVRMLSLLRIQKLSVRGELY